MKEQYYNYIGRSPDDNWVQLSNRLRDFSAAHWTKPIFPWNLQASEVKNHSNLCVQLLTEDDALLTELPRLVLEASNIVYLGLPINFSEHLTSQSIPHTVKTLLLTGEGKFEVPQSAYFPQIERLMASSGELLFEKHNFPNLRYLEFKLDKKGIMLKRLKQFKELKLLTINPFTSEVFSAICNLQLGYLRLNNSKIETLKGIERIETLTDVWLQSWVKLTSLNFLQSLPLLEDVTIAYCKKLEDVNALLEIKELKRLLVWQCKSKPIKQLEVILKNKLEEVSIS